MSTISLDDKLARAKLAVIASKLSDRALRRAESRAVNRAVRGARTEVSKEVRKTVRVKSADVRDAITLKRSRASDAVPTATMVVKQNPIPLVRFGTPRQTKKGVSVTVIKGKRQKIDGAFIVQELGRNIFVRETQDRLPIRKLWGPSVRQLAPQALKNAEPRIAVRLRDELERQVNLEVEKAFNAT